MGYSPWGCTEVDVTEKLTLVLYNLPPLNLNYMYVLPVF